MRSAAMRSFGFAPFRFCGQFNDQVENGGQDAQHTGNGEDGVHLTHGELRHGGNGLLCAGAQLVAAVGDHDVEQDDNRRHKPSIRFKLVTKKSYARTRSL